MSLVDKKYDRLMPSLDYLADEVVLAQAWKKADRYARWHNWYADTLALDFAILEIETDLATWAEQIKDPEFTPEPMQLVPAPKNCAWEFPPPEQMPEPDSAELTLDVLLSPLDTTHSGDWRPKVTDKGKDNDELQPLRPLAHLAIRDQTLAMGLVLCFADAVETLQGPTDQPNGETARAKAVYSYGNRLWCDWHGDGEGSPTQARFRWGNSSTYSSYFEDYRRFLARPGQTARMADALRKQGRVIYVVELDLKRFFDRINRERLLRRLAAIWRRYALDHGYRDRTPVDSEFLDAARRIMGWQWSDDTGSSVHLLEDGLPHGLPQGLVASGALANAYMLRFDRWMGRRLGLQLPNERVIHDYCRYVDDLRLVVEVDRSEDEDSVGKKISDFVQNLLTRYCAGLEAPFLLEINADKTKVIPWADYAMQGSASAQMAWLQKEISATPDQHSLRQATAGLDGLLWLSEVIESSGDQTKNPLALSRIALPKMDVRDDTLKRFAANRLVKSFQLRQSMATDTPEADQAAVPIADGASKRVLEHEMEATARKLIASWSRNPALVPVLRCGLALFPSPDLLAPVLEALDLKRSAGTAVNVRERAVADYVTAELLRAGAVEIGYRDPELLPRGADIEGMRVMLARIARRVLENSEATPWFLRQQAALFLASVLQPVPDLSILGGLEHYKVLHDALLFRKPPSNDEARMVFAGLIGQQLGVAPARFASWLDEILDDLSPELRRVLVANVGHMRPDLLHAAWKVHRDKRTGWTRAVPPYLNPKAYTPGTWERLGESKDQRVPLVKVVLRQDNPFRQENALLGLAVTLLETMARSEHTETRLSWSLLDLSVGCDCWKNPQHPDSRFFINVEGTAGAADPRSPPPPWCRESMQWAYSLGRILRSCIVGDPDFTARGFLVREDFGRYRGLSSSWFKRRLGLLNTPEGLLGEPAPLSPWVSELIMHLLQWPGLRIANSFVQGLAAVETPEHLLRIIKERQAHQRGLYAFQSELPVYSLPASRDQREGNPALRVAMVQTLLPRFTDFDTKNPFYWSPAFRARHRAHLASVCRLVAQHLVTERSAKPPKCDGEGQSAHAGVDLIVFPELAVHPDDLWLLRSLSDTTKSNIFAGLTFQQGSSGAPINRALWMLRQVHDGSREIVKVYQGKQWMTKPEKDMGVVGERPHQVLIELAGPHGAVYRLGGAICYDATDLKLAADLRDKTDCFVIAALNKDVPTFDAMVHALHYHMFQPVVMTNCGEYGGSTAQAPYRERYDKVIAHVHGVGQVAVSVFELDLGEFRSARSDNRGKALKGWPAGYLGRGS